MDRKILFFPQFIKWLSRLPANYALGLLWWGEVTIILCSLAGGYFLSTFFFDHLEPSRQQYLFILAIMTWLGIFYLLHLEFTKISQFMESLVNIHRMGGLQLVEMKLKERKKIQAEENTEENTGKLEDFPDPFTPPSRISASAETFRLRYFIVLPTSLVLYLLMFTSTIYKIFVRQILIMEPGYMVMPALVTAIVCCLCFWFLMPWLPGYVSVRKLIGYKSPEGE